jgi:hypothetical protein
MNEERLQQALEFANYKQTLNNQLHKLKIRVDGMLIFSDSGGKFTINQQLICFLDYLVKTGYKEAVILDDNNSPVKLTDTSEFLKTITNRYFEITNDYFVESSLIKKSRSVKTILNIGEQ